MAFGTFDGLHPGHRDYLRQAKAHGDELIVVVARDATVAVVKQHRPRFPETERLRQVQAVPEVDVAVLGNVGDKYEVIRQFRPQVLCLGYDQQAFTDQLPHLFPQLRIVRLDAYRPERYHTSKLKNLSAKHQILNSTQ